MRAHFLFVALSSPLISIECASAQAWTQRADVGYVTPNGPKPLSAAVSFVIGDDAFVTTGVNLHGVEPTETWRYDTDLDRWEESAPFGGPARRHAASFEIDGMGFVFGGISSGQQQYHNDLWSYDLGLDLWVQKASLPASGRAGSCAFVLDGKAYIFSGHNGDYLNELWEYDPAMDNWIELSEPMPAPRRYAVSFTIAGRAYVSTGQSATDHLDDLWEYDRSTDTWIAKNSYPGAARSGAVAFVLNEQAYVGKGSYNDFWRYDPLIDAWESVEAFNELETGATRSFAVSFVSGGHGYVFTGSNTGTFPTGPTLMSGWNFQPGQNLWSRTRNFGGIPLTGSVAFSIGGYGYAGGGSNGQSSHLHGVPWKYSMDLDEWTEIPDVLGVMFRTRGTSFVIDENAYTCTGAVPDFIGEGMYAWNHYRYHPSTSTVSPIATFTGIQRERSIGFSIAGKGYITCGHTGMWWQPTWLNDLWEYDPIDDNWTEKTPLPAAGRDNSAGFVINNKFYLVGGTFDLSGTEATNEVWEYDPLFDSWTAKSPIPAQPPYSTMIGTAIGEIGVVCVGSSLFTYDPVLDLWMAGTPPPIPFNATSFSFTIGDKAYFGGGASADVNSRNVFYEYSLADDELTTSIAPIPLRSFHLWPNPVQDGHLTVRASSDLDVQQFELRAFDGRQIAAFRMHIGSGESAQLVLPVDLSSGTYLLRASTEQGIIEQKVMVFR